MFYSKLPKEAVKAFDKAYSHYVNPKQATKVHEPEFKKEEDKFFYQANEELYNGNNKHLNYVLKNQKYSYDNNFTYLEKLEDWIVLKRYSKKMLTHILYINLETKEVYGYWNVGFKQTGVNIMVDLNTKYSMGYYNGWDAIYNDAQRLRDKESVEILKSIDKYKYLPIEKFNKINYFILLDATESMINNYEVLLKFGANRVATDLMLQKNYMDKEYFKKYRKQLKENRSLSYINRLIEKENQKIEELKEKAKEKSINDYLTEVNNKHNVTWQYKDFIIRVPSDIDDVKKEASELNHCLYSQRDRYFKKMMKKENILLFMRKIDKQDDPYYTIEIVGDEIVQVRTENNKTNEKVISLVSEWFTSKKNEVLELYS